MGDVFFHHVTGTIKLVVYDLIIQVNKINAITGNG